MCYREKSWHYANVMVEIFWIFTFCVTRKNRIQLRTPPSSKYNIDTDSLLLCIMMNIEMIIVMS